ncbi:MAG: hypothetical protein P1U67_03240 [Alcanivoracaceae bacterium]|nr:hypothetical protein [Alcanivoracaceae bacterium]
MRSLVIALAALLPVASFAAESTSDRLCAAALTEGGLAAEVEQMIGVGAYPFQSADELLTLGCGNGKTLLDNLIVSMQAENLEYAVIDMGANVNRPLMQQEGGKLTLMQYLIQQAVVAPSEDARAFAMDYMTELRDVDFNPNLISLSMN